jgi:hypothetical protein
MDIDDDTPKYLEYLKTQKETLAKAKLRKGQIPQDRWSKEQWCSSFMVSLMMQRTQSKSSGLLLHSSFVPEAYHPCIKSFAELKPITIKSLKLETHHRGTFLILRSLTPPDRMTAIMAVVEDGNGDATLLQLYQQDEEEVRKATDVVDTGTILIVKEPYYKVMSNGRYGLRVDHISDVVFLHEADERVPKAWIPRVIKLDRSAESLKAQGNEAMKKDRYWDAIREYENLIFGNDR